MTRILRPSPVDSIGLQSKLLRMLGVLLAALLLAPGAAPDAAFAGQTIDFPNGGHAQLADDGSIIGTCQLTGGRVTLEDGYRGTIVMPDGSRVQAGCYEAYSGNPNHSLYPGPCDGTYSFKATKRGTGYFVLVYSQNAAGPAVGVVVSEPPAGYTYQRTYGENWTPKIIVSVAFRKSSSDPNFTEALNDYSLSGATYDIYDAETNSKIATITTDASGKATCKLTSGRRYYAVETVAPSGYVLNDKRVSFTAGDKTVDLADEPMRVEVALRKTDSATGGAAQRGATLEGAVYKLVDSQGKTQNATTDAEGRARFSAIPLGPFTIVETKAPLGYKLDTTVHTYQVDASAQHEGGLVSLSLESDFADDVVAFDVELAKYKEDPNAEEGGVRWPAQGVQFQIISKTTDEVVATLTTDEYGFARTSDDAWYGDGTRPDGVKGSLPFDSKGYLVREVASTVPDGYEQMEDFTIDASEQVDGVRLKYIIENKTPAARLQIVKTDALSGQTVPLAGFSFRILTEDGEPITQNEWYPNHVKLDTFTTDDSGCTTLPEQLVPGTYLVEEVKAQPPYLLADKPHKVKLRAEGGNVAVVRFGDEQATGTAGIHKTDANTGKVLEGAVYDVVSCGTVVAPDGTVQAVENEVLGSVSTDETGVATIEDLPLGRGKATYAFVETKAPDGYVLDATPHEFTLEYVDGNTAVVEAHVDATNAPTEIVVKKTECGSGTPLEGVSFQLVQVPSDGNDEKSDGLTQTTDSKGIARWTHLAPGNYSFVETETQSGYVLDNQTRVIEIDEQGTALYEGVDADELNVENDFTKVDLSKRDITNEEELAGAHLVLLNDKEEVVDHWVSEAAPHRIDRLAPGTYTLKEERTPSTHDVAEDVTFTVEQTGELQIATMYDTPIEIGGAIDKRQEIAQPTAANTFANGDGKNRAETHDSDLGEYSYSLDYKNDSNTWVDELTVTDTLTCCESGLASLKSIETPVSQGDYDAKLNVWYMTNSSAGDSAKSGAISATASDGHENPWLFGMETAHPLDAGGRALSYTGWKLWAADVPTNESVELPVEDLGLQEGERVVAIRFEYGCVSEDFTTRADDWGREDIKDAHDDSENIGDLKRGDEESDALLFPAILHMRVTDSYAAGTTLENCAQIDIFRNGGGEKLEAHDSDRVEQTAGSKDTPVSPLVKMPKTGDIARFSVGVVLTAAVIAIAAGFIHKTSGEKTRRNGLVPYWNGSKSKSRTRLSPRRNQNR